MTCPRRLAREQGFSLPEMMVAMTIMLIILGGVFTAMTHAMSATESARLVTGMNNNLRTAMDLVVRDFIQTGQGLPTGRRVDVPNGGAAVDINRPSPPGPALTFTADASLSAVSVGPGLGPPINGQPTDIITVLVGDGAFSRVGLTALAADGSSVTVEPGTDITDGDVDDVRVGDLIMLTRGTGSTLLQATGVVNQTVSFAANDSLMLNQFDAALAMQGTVNQLLAAGLPEPVAEDVGPPVVLAETRATRVWMITYYLDNTLDPAGSPRSPRLMRRVNMLAPTTVAFAMENLRITYDITDGVTNPTAVAMVAADLDGTGRCNPNPCSENLIRKVNTVLAGRSGEQLSQTRRFYRNSLFTQVSLRSLSFVDRY